jgi:hypothetical protein
MPKILKEKIVKAVKSSEIIIITAPAQFASHAAKSSGHVSGKIISNIVLLCV